MVSEYVSHGRLIDEILKRKSLTEEEVMYMSKQLISAINYCHDKGVTHGNLTLDNIMIDSISADKKISIKIISFGEILTHPKDRKQNKLTYYIAPELTNCSGKCDMWSIGIIIHILLSGTLPFHGTSDDEVLENAKIGNFEFQGSLWEEVSDSAKDLIKQLLVSDPSKRMSAAEALNHKGRENTSFKIGRANV